jgi:hypothetical protein
MTIDSLFDQLQQRMQRREWIANPVDPTTVLQWQYRGRFVRLTLTTVWDTEARVDVVTGWSRLIPARYRHRTFHVFRSYGAHVCYQFVARLEDAHTRYETQFDDDPMGRLSDYE